jgi:transposase-like protein
MPGHGSQLGRRKEAAVAALLANRTTEEAAREAGVKPRTLLRWMKLPEFREVWLQARREGLSQATSRLQQGTGAAVSIMLKTMVDPTISPSMRLRAARDVLEFAHRGAELEDLELRLARLERDKEC